MNSEVEAAFERLLATVPPETHAVLRSAKYRLGIAKLVAENAERHGVDVVLPEWGGLYDCDYFELQFAVLGNTFTIKESQHSGGLTVWAATKECANGDTMWLNGTTFTALFVMILQVIRGEYVFDDDGNGMVAVAEPYAWWLPLDSGVEGSGEH